METPKDKKPGDFTLTVPLNREKTKTATFYMKDINETVFMAVRSLNQKGKELEAVRLMVKELTVSGDDPALLNDNFIATQSASFLLAELMTPVEGELKKN